MKKVFYLLTLSVLFLVGCSTEELQTTDSSNAGLNQEFSKNISNAPEQSGTYLFRNEISFGVLIIDWERGISATFGVDAEAACNGEPFWDYADNQYINVPSDEFKRIFLTQGEVFTNVLDGVPTGDICDFLLNTPSLGQGMTKFVQTDNDLFVSEGNNTNTWGLRGHGRLINQDNKTKNLTVITHFVFDKEDRFTATESLRLQK